MTFTNKKKSWLAIEFIVSAIVILIIYSLIPGNKSPWPENRIKLDSGNRQFIGTFARVVAIAEDSHTAQKSIDSSFNKISVLERLLSRYEIKSEITQLNRKGFKKPLKISPPTFYILQKAIEFSKLSDGAFDITAGPLIELWQKAAKTNTLPSDIEIEKAREKVGYEKLTLDPENMTAQLASADMKLDVAAIAKGYAIDQVVLTMQNSGAIGGVVDIGGDIRSFGAPPKGKNYWLIGLQNPQKTKDPLGTGEILLTLKLKDSAVTTSGDYRRFALIEGKRHSHIIDTKTGLSSAKLSSVTIITQNAIDADALATAVTVMGPEKGLELIEKIPNTEAILISLPPEYKIIKTTGAQKYIN